MVKIKNVKSKKPTSHMAVMSMIVLFRAIFALAIIFLFYNLIFSAGFVFYVFKTNSKWIDPSPYGSRVNLTDHFAKLSNVVYEMVLFRDDWFEESEIYTISESKIKSMQYEITNADEVINQVNVNYYDRANIKNSSFSISENGLIQTLL